MRWYWKQYGDIAIWQYNFRNKYFRNYTLIMWDNKIAVFICFVFYKNKSGIENETSCIDTTVLVIFVALRE